MFPSIDCSASALLERAEDLREQEFIEQAHARPMCWRCNHPYPTTPPTCPNCGAINPNIDFDGAVLQMEQGA